MIIFPAIDLFEHKAVRLLKGNYKEMTVYSNNPVEIAKKFEGCGCKAVHIVDLEGAKYGTTPNFDVITEIAEKTSLYTEVGGGIRSLETIEKYLESGVSRVILGTSAVCDEDLLCRAVGKYGDRIAVGADIKDGMIAIKGWIEKSMTGVDEFFSKMCSIGVKTVICTDISKDGAMAGTNVQLYRSLSEKFNINITASGGVSSIADVVALRKMNLYGAIIGKAYYTGAINLEEATEAAK